MKNYSLEEIVKVWQENNFVKENASDSIGMPRSTFRGKLREAVKRGIISSDKIETVDNEFKQKIDLTLKNGIIIIGSDAHYYPSVVSPAHKAFVKICKEIQPSIIVMNGDAFDGGSISRFSPSRHKKVPDVQDEMEETKFRLEDIELACPKAKKIWTLGNHDQRYESRLAAVAPEFARVKGFRLEDHFPRWQLAWSLCGNNDIVVKHRFKGGIHATHNNTVWAGKTIVTGHLHSMKVTPFTDYNGTRFGIDDGCLANIDPRGDQFEYTEENPLNWRMGFTVLTIKDGRLLWPELVFVRNNKEFEFRGEVYKI